MENKDTIKERLLNISFMSDDDFEGLLEEVRPLLEALEAVVKE